MNSYKNSKVFLNRNAVAYKTVIAVFMAVLGIFAFFFDNPLLLGLLIILLSALSTYISRYDWRLAAVSFSLCFSNYSIVYANYINKADNMFTAWANDPVSSKGLVVILFFSIIYFIALPMYTSARRVQNQKRKSLIVENPDNPIIAIGAMFILLIILIYGFDRPEQDGIRGTPTPLFEYSIIFFILGFYYSGGRKWVNVVLSIIMIMFAATNFIYGGRVTGLQLAICWLLCVMIDRLQYKFVLPVGIFAFVVLSGIGMMRANFSFSLSNLENAYKSLVSSGFVLDTAYSAYFTSLTFIKVSEIIPFWNRIELFLRFLLSMIFGGSAISDSNLAYYTYEYYTHYYGGILPFFGYFYLGWLGVGLTGVLVAFWQRVVLQATTESRGLIRCLSVYIAASSFRWYLYSPSNLLRGALILAACYFVCLIFHRFFLAYAPS